MKIRIAGLIFSILVFLLSASSACFGYNAEKEIDRFITMKENDIDIGIVALTLSKEVFPNIDIQAYSKRIDIMVSDIRRLTKGSTDPDYRVRAMNTYLYKRKGFAYDTSDLETKKPENRFLSGYMDTRKGSCVTMPLLYLVLAQRLGYPVYPVPAPDHLFLRYIEPGFL
jgi:regulator of sirC expression with transglutaminase-like and TPR domain